MISLPKPNLRTLKKRPGALLVVALFVAGALLLVAATASPVTISFETSTEVGEEIIVRFARPITEDAAKARFRIEPSVAGDLVWLEEYRELRFVPQEGFAPDVSYTVRVAAPLQFLAATVVPNQQTYRFASAKSRTYAHVVVEAPPAQGKYIDVNLHTMQLTLFENGKAVKSLPVAGKGNPWSTPTRQGRFKILSKEALHWSTIYRLWMPYSMNYSGDYFLHGWPYWPNGVRLTSVYSGGCIRLRDEVAKEVFEWAEVGTPVTVHETPGLEPFTVEVGIRDGDLVRESSDPRVFVVKHVGEKRFKRHARTDDFEDWYGHLSPFWSKVKTVPDGTLAGYQVSRWVRIENQPVYEVDDRGIRHLVTCGGTDPLQCANAWATHGWDPDEIFMVSYPELDSYPLGDAFSLKQSSLFGSQ